MRIATWNLAGRWSPAHLELLLGLDCDVLLLTEVSERVEVPGHAAHVGRAVMAPRRRWAGVLSRTNLRPLPDPHPASAAAVVDGVTFCSSVLPWRGCGTGAPWGDGNHAARTERTVTTLLQELTKEGLVWGGDFNHALEGREYAGSMGGRRAIQATLDELGLAAATTRLPHQIEPLISIDHIAVPTAWTVRSASRVSALTGTGRLSDHDAYVAEVTE